MKKIVPKHHYNDGLSATLNDITIGRMYIMLRAA